MLILPIKEKLVKVVVAVTARNALAVPNLKPTKKTLKSKANFFLALPIVVTESP